MPRANVGPLAIPTSLADEPVFLSDILPTGYQAVVNADKRDDDCRKVVLTP